MTQPTYLPDEQTEQLLGQVTLDTQEGFIPPYRHFKGTVVNIKSRWQQSRNDPNRSFLVVSLQIGSPGFEMISCNIPWENPTLEHDLVLFDPQEIRTNSAPGVFLDSAKQCLGGKQGIKIMELKGKHIEVMYTRDHPINTKVGENPDITNKNTGKPQGVYEDVPSLAFEVIAVDGQRNPKAHQPWNSGEPTEQAEVPAPQPVANNATSQGYDFLLAILDGKTQAQFESEAFNLPQVQQDPVLFGHFANGTVNSVINQWLAEGKVTKSGDGSEAVFQKVS